MTVGPRISGIIPFYRAKPAEETRDKTKFGFCRNFVSKLGFTPRFILSGYFK